MFLHRIPRQSGSFGEGRELCDLRVEAHIVPQLALFLGQLFWRGDARKLLLEIFAFLVHLHDQHFKLLLALLAGMGIDIAGGFLAIGPLWRVAPFKEMVVDLGDAAGAGSALAAYIGLEVGHSRLFRLGRGSFLPRP